MYCGCQLGIMFFFNEKLYKKLFFFFYNGLVNFHLCRVNTCIVQYFSSKFQYQRLYYMYIYCVCVCWTEIIHDQNGNELWCKIFVWFHFQLCMSKISSFKELCKTSQFIYEIFVFLQTLVKLKIRDIDTYTCIVLEYSSNCPWFNAVFFQTFMLYMIPKYVSFWYILFGYYWLHKIFLEDDICQEAFITSVNMKAIC